MIREVREGGKLLIVAFLIARETIEEGRETGSESRRRIERSVRDGGRRGIGCGYSQFAIRREERVRGR